MTKVIKPNLTHLPSTPDHCPNCGSRKLAFYGTVRSPIQLGLENGHAIGRRAVRAERQDIVWERISCVKCGVECECTDERILQLQDKIDKLQFQLAFITGRLVPENFLPC
jgi:hypothetical protein